MPQLAVHIVGRTFQSGKIPVAAAVKAFDAHLLETSDLFFKKFRRTVFGGEAFGLIVAPVVDVSEKSAGDFVMLPFGKVGVIVAGELHSHIGREFFGGFGRVQIGPVADDERLFAGTVFFKTFGKFQMELPESFARIFAAGEGKTVGTFARDIAVRLGQFHHFCSGIQTVEHLFVDQFFHSGIGKAVAVVVHGVVTLALGERIVFRVAFAVFGLGDRFVMGVAAVNINIPPAHVSSGIVVDMQRSGGGGSKFQRRFHLFEKFFRQLGHLERHKGFFGGQNKFAIQKFLHKVDDGGVTSQIVDPGRVPGTGLAAAGIIVSCQIDIPVFDTHGAVEVGVFSAIGKADENAFLTGDGFGGFGDLDLDPAVGKGGFEDFCAFGKGAGDGAVKTLFRQHDGVG